eukprot:1087147-Alexandrium_andersonii.AAC.1
MSASLVGSEMCIRDSATNAWAEDRPVERRRASKFRVLRSGRNRLPTSYPVSYTHLTLPTICSV